MPQFQPWSRTISAYGCCPNYPQAMKHLLHVDTIQTMSKKVYEKPVLTKVILSSQETVLAGCKFPGGDKQGPNVNCVRGGRTCSEYLLHDGQYTTQ